MSVPKGLMERVEALREVAAEVAERTRREQGLPRYPEDRAGVDRLAALLDVGDREPLGRAS